MRSDGNFNFNNTTASSPSSPSLGGSEVPQSPWHSPIPYLFGGLAAMLGLIAFALLILACSYWKFSSYLDENGVEDAERDVENGEKKDGDSTKAPQVYEEKIVVIMAGDHKPTFLATPTSSNKACSCGEGHNNKSNIKVNDVLNKNQKPGQNDQETSHQMEMDQNKSEAQDSSQQNQ